MQELTLQEIKQVNGGILGFDDAAAVGALLMTPVSPLVAGVVIGAALVAAAGYIYYNS